jgi:hypothetical protein
MFTLAIAAVPEPGSTFALLGLALTESSIKKALNI